MLQNVIKVTVDDDDDEDDETGVQQSAGVCLHRISKLIGNDVLDPVIVFVKNYISSPEWQKRYAAIICLGIITEGPEKPAFCTILTPSLDNLFQMF